MKKSFGIFLIFSIFGPYWMHGANAGTIYYCEVIESVLISEHKASRTNSVGAKFKLEVVSPKRFPGGSLRFSENSPIGGDFEIIDSWGGIDNTFIAKEKGSGGGVLHFLKGYVTFTHVFSFGGLDGPTWGAVSSSNCEKF